MQIVIEIPQGLKIDIENENWTALTCAEMKNALQNGTVIPDNHGRLVDADAITKDLNTLTDSFVINMDKFGRGIVSICCTAPTILEGKVSE